MKKMTIFILFTLALAGAAGLNGMEPENAISCMGSQFKYWKDLGQDLKSLAIQNRELFAIARRYLGCIQDDYTQGRIFLRLSMYMRDNLDDTIREMKRQSQSEAAFNRAFGSFRQNNDDDMAIFKVLVHTLADKFNKTPVAVADKFGTVAAKNFLMNLGG